MGNCLVYLWEHSKFHCNSQPVFHRWREDIIKRRKKLQEEGELPENEADTYDPSSVDSERYKKWEKRFSNNIDQMHTKMKNNSITRIIFVTCCSVSLYLWIMLIANVHKRLK